MIGGNSLRLEFAILVLFVLRLIFINAEVGFPFHGKGPLLGLLPLSLRAVCQFET